MRRVLVSLVMAVPILLDSVISQASTEAGEHGLPPFSEYLRNTLSFWINFAVYVGLLYFLLRKPFAKAWEARRARWSESMKAAGESLTKSRERLTEAQSKLATVEDERRRLRQEIEQEAREEARRIVESARRRAEGVLRAAQDSGKAERAAAERVVQNEIIEMASSLARSRLAREVDVNNDRPARQAVVSTVKDLVQ